MPMTNAQKKMLARLTDLNAPSFRVNGRSVDVYDAERSRWVPKLMFGRGEQVAFRSLVAAGVVVPHVVCTTAQGKVTDGYEVKGQFCNCDTCGAQVRRDSLMVDEEGASYCEKCRLNNVVEGLRSFMKEGA